ncbi:hypothetical protein TNCV_2096201 [Trichonephila clavipes]|nr:hypothetical protein TNCV_2096201 [Trichonephila clavipes]
MIEMARLLEKKSQKEVRAVILFLSAKNVSTSAMSRQHVAKFCHSFQSGRTGRQKLQYDWERPAKFFNDRNHHGTNCRKDSK